MFDTDVILESEPGVFAGVVDAYRRDGFDAGYQRAQRDFLAGLILAGEEFLRQPGPANPDLRKTLYSFIDRVEQQLGDGLDHNIYVESGLGI